MANIFLGILDLAYSRYVIWCGFLARIISFAEGKIRSIVMNTTWISLFSMELCYRIFQTFRWSNWKLASSPIEKAELFPMLLVRLYFSDAIIQFYCFDRSSRIIQPSHATSGAVFWIGKHNDDKWHCIGFMLWLSSASRWLIRSGGCNCSFGLGRRLELQLGGLT